MNVELQSFLRTDFSEELEKATSAINPIGSGDAQARADVGDIPSDVSERVIRRVARWRSTIEVVAREEQSQIESLYGRWCSNSDFRNNFGFLADRGKALEILNRIVVAFASGIRNRAPGTPDAVFTVNLEEKSGYWDEADTFSLGDLAVKSAMLIGQLPESHAIATGTQLIDDFVLQYLHLPRFEVVEASNGTVRFRAVPPTLDLLPEAENYDADSATTEPEAADTEIMAEAVLFARSPDLAELYERAFLVSRWKSLDSKSPHSPEYQVIKNWASAPDTRAWGLIEKFAGGRLEGGEHSEIDESVREIIEELVQLTEVRIVSALRFLAIPMLTGALLTSDKASKCRLASALSTIFDAYNECAFPKLE